MRNFSGYGAPDSITNHRIAQHHNVSTVMSKILFAHVSRIKLFAFSAFVLVIRFIPAVEIITNVIHDPQGR